jgi:hypothetical protein
LLERIDELDPLALLLMVLFIIEPSLFYPRLNPENCPPAVLLIDDSWDPSRVFMKL